MINTTLQKFSTILPQPHLDTWNRLLAHTINNPNPVMICLAGKRGLGKTSLMNMLLGDAVLPAGADSIQIPVHVLQGEALDVRLTDASGQKRGLDIGNLSEALASVQYANAHLEISAPLEWLRGAVLVDVPDLEAFTSRYFQQTDAFVYLIDSGGPNEADIRFIQTAIAAGQQVMVAAAQWDIVEERVKQGFMTMPDIQAWEDQLQQVTGKEIYVTPAARGGTGMFALATHVQNVVRSREVLRKERLLSVGLPVLTDIFKDFLVNSQTDTAKQSAKAAQFLEKIKEVEAEKAKSIAEFRKQLEARASDLSTAYHKISNLEAAIKSKDKQLTNLLKKVNALEAEKNAEYALHIKTDPPKAKVSVFQPVMDYSAGMKVKPGKYQIKVQCPDYEAKEQWLEVSNRDVEAQIVLQKILYELRIKTDPAKAKVSIIKPAMDYRYGMKVKQGKYEVQVTMAGYDTKVQWLEATDRDVEASIVLAKTVVQKHPRYVKLGHGGVGLSDDATQAQGWLMTRDKHTGLIWELKNNTNKDDKYTWNDAATVYIRQLNHRCFGGFSDWRLPTKEELESLIKKGTTPTIDADWFPCTVSSGYWSATTYVGNTNGAWRVSFYDGDVYYGNKSDSYYVRAVRAGQ